jgi:hypothetical protein
MIRAARNRWFIDSVRVDHRAEICRRLCRCQRRQLETSIHREQWQRRDEVRHPATLSRSVWPVNVQHFGRVESLCLILQVIRVDVARMRLPLFPRQRVVTGVVCRTVKNDAVRDSGRLEVITLDRNDVQLHRVSQPVVRCQQRERFTVDDVSHRHRAKFLRQSDLFRPAVERSFDSLVRCLVSGRELQPWPGSDQSVLIPRTMPLA